jgi:nucleoside-diphosphate-sugar epimerase
MRLLILGGSWFLGRVLAGDALARGWRVTAFTRGRSGPPPDGVTHVTGDRTRAEDRARLAEAGPWDATIDTSAYEPGDLAAVLAALGPAAGRYVLLSTAARTALRTVLRDNPSFLAIALIGIPSPRCRWRISAQSSNLITLHVCHKISI